MGSIPVGELGKSFFEYLTWEHFYIDFHFIQITISLIKEITSLSQSHFTDEHRPVVETF